jgi:hypothetical protein
MPGIYGREELFSGGEGIHPAPASVLAGRPGAGPNFGGFGPPPV